MNSYVDNAMNMKLVLEKHNNTAIQEIVPDCSLYVVQLNITRNLTVVVRKGSNWFTLNLKAARI
ncbi:hypothetical protein NC651_024983 [Populus alba x Populus x berolinensis]|nr:hypothetical protein NC651_024983 [Populus alba x Populus x berolinensis]